MSLSEAEVRYESLGLLSMVMRAFALEFLAKLAEQGIPVKIIETWRTVERHQKLLAEGRSWTANSKHLRTRVRANGVEVPASDAIDLAPWGIWNLNGPDKLQWEDHPTWHQMGEIGEVTGLGWGGRWTKRDLGHWELSDV